MKEKTIKNWFNTLNNVELPTTTEQNILNEIRKEFNNGNDCCSIVYNNNEFTIDFVNSISYGNISNFPYSHIIIYESGMDTNLVFATTQQINEICTQLGCNFDNLEWAINDCGASIIEL